MPTSTSTFNDEIRQAGTDAYNASYAAATSAGKSHTDADAEAKTAAQRARAAKLQEQRQR